MESNKTKLTPKQFLFCLHYLKKGTNGEKAAIAAGYSKNTAKQIAAENLTKPYLRDEINRLRANKEETCGLTVEYIIEMQMEIINDPKTEPQIRQRAIQSLVDIMGYDAPVKQSVTIDNEKKINISIDGKNIDLSK